MNEFKIMLCSILLFLSGNSVFSQQNLRLKTVECTKDNIASCNVYASDSTHFVSGDFKGDLILDFNALQSDRNAVFIAKELADGSVSWLNMFNCSGVVHSYTIDTKKDLLLVGGVFSDSLFIEDDTLVGGAGSTAFLTVYDTSGVYQYTYLPQADYANIYSVKIAENDTVYITGDFFNTFTFNGNSYNISVDYNMFLLKYHVPTSNEIWFKHSVGKGCYGKSMDLTPNGDVVIIGSYGASTSFEGNMLPSNPSDHNLYVAKYQSNGTLSWVQPLTGSMHFHGMGIAAGEDGSVYFSGEFEMMADLPDQSMFMAVGLRDGIVGKFNAMGQFQWAKQFGSPDKDAVVDLEIDKNGHVIALMNAGSITNFQGTNLPANGFIEPLIVKLNQMDGSLIWNKRIQSQSPSGVVTALSLSRVDSLITVCGTNKSGLWYNNTVFDSQNVDDAFWFTFKDMYTSGLGINENLSNSIKIYPNPFDSDFYIENNGETYTLKIKDMMGKILYSAEIAGMAISKHNLGDIPRGSYFIEIETSVIKQITTLIKL